jgi:putative aldouronate transport system permease protein
MTVSRVNRPKRRKDLLNPFGFWDVVIYALLLSMAFLCLMPVLNMFALSFSAASAADAGIVYFWPVRFTLAAYEEIVREGTYFRAFGISVLRVVLGLTVSMFFMVTMAYPLSKPKADFRFRPFFSWTLVFTMLFGGGMIPTYMVMRSYGLLDTIWVLVLPGCVAAGNTTLMMKFFSAIPSEMEEAAEVDGAGVVRTLVQLYLPMSVPSLATMSLFVIVGHWNAYFDGLLYISKNINYPLQTYIRSLTINVDLSTLSVDEMEHYLLITARNFNAAKIVVSMVPVLLVYPFLQRYFVKGLVLGAVKG